MHCIIVITMGRKKRSSISVSPEILEMLRVNKYLCNVTNWNQYFDLNMRVLNHFGEQFSRVFAEVVAGDRKEFPIFDKIQVEGLREEPIPEDIKDIMVSHSRKTGEQKAEEFEELIRLEKEEFKKNPNHQEERLEKLKELEKENPDLLFLEFTQRAGTE